MRLPFLVARVGAALRAAGTPARGEALVIGLSGGPDSVALLDALTTLRRPRGFRLIAAHLDHQLRSGSGEDAAFCASLCDGLGVPIRLGAADVRARAAREPGGLEQAARRERYAFLARVRDEERAAAVAVAHTSDDQAETLLLRLLRGAGATGLSGMRPRSGSLLRPLLRVSRGQVLTHLAARGLAFREDPSNLDPVHLRNRVRHELLPYLEGRFNPGVRRTLARTAELLAEEAAFLRVEAARLLRGAASDEADAVVLRRAALAQAAPAVARAALRLALSRTGGLADLGAGHVERILQLARSSGSAAGWLPLPGERRVRLTRDAVRFERAAAPPGKAV